MTEFTAATAAEIAACRSVGICDEKLFIADTGYRHGASHFTVHAVRGRDVVQVGYGERSSGGPISASEWSSGGVSVWPFDAAVERQRAERWRQWQASM